MMRKLAAPCFSGPAQRACLAHLAARQTQPGERSRRVGACPRRPRRWPRRPDDYGGNDENAWVLLEVAETDDTNTTG